MNAPVGEMLSRVRRAARNGTRLHLDPEHVRLLLDNEIYSVLTALEAKEMRASCRNDETPRTASSSALSGFGIVPTATIGASAGLTAVSHAADRQELEAAAQIIHLKKRKSA